MLNTHCLRYGLLGSLILFDPHTLVPERQIQIGYCFRYRMSSRYQQISPFLQEFNKPPLELKIISQYRLKRVLLSLLLYF
jgi:hypothetical protein